ncbi:MAG: triose-phosphate isomerase [Desulfofustis sp.]|nr:triose-phosphate isomerase [Desulfofustis sp.]NNK56458.1 triose-phosphate isomerase [Desulfofustis sp.]
MPRRALIAGNWKMHKTAAKAKLLAEQLAAAGQNATDRDILLAPPFTALSAVEEGVRGSGIIVAGQNVCWEEQGAFTGEISPVMLKDLGATAAIVGHSERRQIFGETDTMINRRLRGALHQGLTMVLCIGETLDERESGDTLAILERQVRSGLAEVSSAQMASVVIAYEPVWAIGTGKTATAGQAQDAHGFIRSLVSDLYEKDIGNSVRILYGGSVKPANIDELMAQPDIDGALVGGASLDAESFGRIINYK